MFMDSVADMLEQQSAPDYLRRAATAATVGNVLEIYDGALRDQRITQAQRTVERYLHLGSIQNVLRDNSELVGK
jgi:hypothetical protein